MFENDNELNKSMTEARSILWEYLKGNKLLCLPFWTQHPLDHFIADFYCHPLKLVIQIDSSLYNSEEQKEYGSRRETIIKRGDIKIIYIKEKEIENNIDQVIESIKKECALRHMDLESDH